jgi:hypothetical protein
MYGDPRRHNHFYIIVIEPKLYEWLEVKWTKYFIIISGRNCIGMERNGREEEMYFHFIFLIN